MANAGIIMHIRHLEAVGWERLVWGVPEEDSLGDLPKVVELLLDEAECEPITTIVFGCGPSEKDGLSEGEYTKQFLLRHLPALSDFPRFKDRLNQATLSELRHRLEGIIVTPRLERSIDEIITASSLFAEHSITKVFQVTAASHAPRCVQIQAAVRAKGLIPKDQQWFLVATDRCFEGADPFSTLIMEPPHRGDDPMINVSPSVPQALRDYQYSLSVDAKKELGKIVGDFISNHAQPSDTRNLSAAKTMLLDQCLNSTKV